jgi:glucuronosyltransferase
MLKPYFYIMQMTFWQRLINIAIVSGLRPIPLMPSPPDQVLDKYRQFGQFDSLDELMSRSKLFLFNKDFVLDYPKPSMPNMIDVGGLTAKPSNGQLPRDMEDFIQGAKKGIILVSFGSVWFKFPVEIAAKMMSVFGSLEGYRVIWRLGIGDKLPIPNNVLIADWLPQNDLLAHPAVKLFITHGGNNGQYEAIYHEVPMIGTS